MNTEGIPPFYESPVKFDASRIRAAAVYCSDGRYGEQFDDLMQTSLKLPRYDRLAVPGGAACLARHFAIYREEEGVSEQLRFLVKVHGLERVVLIATKTAPFTRSDCRCLRSNSKLNNTKTWSRPFNVCGPSVPTCVSKCFLHAETPMGQSNFKPLPCKHWPATSGRGVVPRSQSQSRSGIPW